MKNSVSGKTILVTGSTDGLGKLVARHLAEQNATVLLHGRDAEKGKQVLQELISQTGNQNIRYYNGDFASFSEVGRLSKEIIQNHTQIDVLINNVGIGSGKVSDNNQRRISKDGIELRFQVNYLSHVLLTEKLLSILSPNAVIINVASIGQEPIDFDNLMLEQNYDGFFAYKQSKTALIMYTFDLAERLKNSGIRVNVLHPASLMNTKMVFEDWNYTLTTVEQGAEATENLLFPDSTGEYYDMKRKAKAISQTYISKARAALWIKTQELLSEFL
ncbi:MAG: SDR family NAD(P)-dependent oxidoreductase [Prolixibacteraceae bacterium]|jgi:NAD(P)-dependent dehydrogenase (short-subunit alcohol dehydrogenase family)